jgi:hypothetical protein
VDGVEAVVGEITAESPTVEGQILVSSPTSYGRIPRLLLFPMTQRLCQRKTDRPRPKSPQHHLRSEIFEEADASSPSNPYDPYEDLRCQEAQIWGEEEIIVNYLPIHVLLSEKGGVRT